MTKLDMIRLHFEKSKLDLENDSEALIRLVAETFDRQSVNARKTIYPAGSSGHDTRNGI